MALGELGELGALGALGELGEARVVDDGVQVLFDDRVSVVGDRVKVVGEVKGLAGSSSVGLYPMWYTRSLFDNSRNPG